MCVLLWCGVSAVVWMSKTTNSMYSRSNRNSYVNINKAHDSLHKIHMQFLETNLTFDSLSNLGHFSCKVKFIATLCVVTFCPASFFLSFPTLESWRSCAAHSKTSGHPRRLWSSWVDASSGTWTTTWSRLTDSHLNTWRWVSGTPLCVKAKVEHPQDEGLWENIWLI